MDPYIPEILPLENIDYKSLFAVVGEANAALARYDGLLQAVVNPAVMLSPLTTQEAVLSSKIEGTQATIDEVLEQDAGLIKDGEKYTDIQEIVNYRKALFAAHDHLQSMPITLNFIRQIHKILLDSVRGQNKEPGEFRKDQNWIGAAGCSIDEATFVPPSPLQLNDFLEQWQSYMRGNDLDILLQVAVIHAQFELLHPFKDGNGRIGRILIPLFLYQKEVLSQPMFYLSSYLEANREEYYLRLRNISQKCDWDGWILFFLKAVKAQAVENSERVKEIINLYDFMKTRVHELTRSQYSLHVVDALFDSPIFRTTDFVSRTGIHKKTALGLLGQLKTADLIETVIEASGRTPAVLCFPSLLEIVK